MSDRRDFFKMFGVSAGGMLLGNCGKESIQSSITPKVLSNAEKEQMIYAELSSVAKKIVTDSNFKTAVSKMDFNVFYAQLEHFKTKIKLYNDFHRHERRLWALKIGNKSINAFEADYKMAIPNAIANYTAAFGSMSVMLDMLEKSNFSKVVNNHFSDLCNLLKDEKSSIQKGLIGFFTDLGCSKEMVAEFKAEFSKIDYDFAGLSSNDIANLRTITEESVQAQVAILEYSKIHGLNYLRGKCGPPEWAIVVSEILAWAGISVAAWVVVVIIVVLIAALITICVVWYNDLPNEIKNLCGHPTVIDLIKW